MAVLQIVEHPDKRLRLESKPVEKITDEIKTLAEDMAETMYKAPGIGLAAPQIGQNIRMVVIDVTGADEENMLYTMINPEITSKEGETSYEEGCLSVPGAFEEVKRAETIEVEYTDLEGAKQKLKADGLLAICTQHELDHLDGKLFIDRISGLKRKLAVRRMDRFKKEREKNQQNEESVNNEF